MKNFQKCFQSVNGYWQIYNINVNPFSRQRKYSYKSLSQKASIQYFCNYVVDRFSSPAGRKNEL